MGEANLILAGCSMEMKCSTPELGGLTGMLRPSRHCISIEPCTAIPLLGQSRARADTAAPAGTCSAVLGGGDPA